MLGAPGGLGLTSLVRNRRRGQRRSCGCRSWADEALFGRPAYVRGAIESGLGTRDLGVRARGFSYDGNWFALKRGVFDPVRHLSGIAFADQLHDLVSHLVPDARAVLDLGTGCGLLAATMARLGLHVLATDVSETACRCAAQNCRELDVEVRHGDMFATLERERFDLVVVNPPYERVDPTWRRSSAFTSSDFLERLGASVHQFAPLVVIGFPADDAAELDTTGLDLEIWRTVKTSGDDLGLFVSTI